MFDINKSTRTRLCARVIKWLLKWQIWRRKGNPTQVFLFKIFILTFIRISISGSGLMLASFSLLDNSTNMSAKLWHSYQSVQAFKRQCTIYKGYLMFWLTITGPNPLTSSREGQCFSHCHFSHMAIMLTYISRCPLWNKLTHSMAIICNSPWRLQLSSSTQFRL